MSACVAGCLCRACKCLHARQVQPKESFHTSPRAARLDKICMIYSHITSKYDCHGQTTVSFVEVVELRVVRLRSHDLGVLGDTCGVTCHLGQVRGFRAGRYV